MSYHRDMKVQDLAVGLDEARIGDLMTALAALIDSLDDEGLTNSVRELLASALQQTKNVERAAIEVVETELAAGLSEESGHLAAILAKGDPEADRIAERLEAIREWLRDYLDSGGLWQDKSGSELTKWVLACLPGVPQEDIAEILGVSTKTVRRWDKGSGGDEPTNRDRLLAAIRIIGQLRYVFPPIAIARWLLTPQTRFDGASPSQLLDDAEQALRLSREVIGLRGA